MTAQIIPFPTRFDPWIGKRDLAKRLGRSMRWVEMRVKEGMPSDRLANGRLRFKFNECMTWLDEHHPVKVAV